MLTKLEKIERLQMAVALLKDADAMMQAALGASDECYELHCAIEDTAEGIAELAEQLENA
jgi:hypothetical protein